MAEENKPHRLSIGEAPSKSSRSSNSPSFAGSDATFKDFCSHSYAGQFLNKQVKNIRQLISPTKLKITGGVYIAVGRIVPYFNYEVKTKDNSTKVDHFLHIEVVKAQNLVDADAFGVSDSFVVLKLNDVPIGRTDVVQGDLNPVYTGEAFEVPIFDPANSLILTIEVWDMDAGSVGEFMGRCVLPLGDTKLPFNKDKFARLDEIYCPLRPFKPLYPKEKLVPPPYFKSSGEEMHKFRTLIAQSENYETYTDVEGDNAGENHIVEDRDRTFSVQRHINPDSLKSPEEQLQSREDCNLSVSGGGLEDREIMMKESQSRSIRNLEVEDVESSKSVIYGSIFLIVLYMVFTVVGYSYVYESYTVRESLYMAVVTFTTVGYGDILPTKDSSKVFASFHVFLGLSIICTGVGILTSAFVREEIAASERREEELESRTLELMEGDREDDEGKDEEEGGGGLRAEADSFDDENREGHTVVVNLDDEDLEKLDKKVGAFSNEAANLAKKTIKIWVLVIILIAVFALIVGHEEGWSGADMFYFSVVTSTSVGYGDISPTKASTQWLAVFMIPICVGLTSATLAQTISGVFEYHAAKAARKLFFHQFNLDDIGSIQADDKKKIKKHEFLAFMLIMMKKVDHGVIDSINRQFDEMDADKNGFLEPIDLEIINRNKKRVRRMQLSRIHGKRNGKIKEVSKELLDTVRRENHIDILCKMETKSEEAEVEVNTVEVEMVKETKE